jgi:phenylalanyl-tRNA synthetase beta chain
MRISLDWLRDYVSLDLPLAQLVEKLNMVGLMVESHEEKDGDIVLEIETYSNRPDTLGHLGIAREIAASLKLPLKEPVWPLAEVEEKTSDCIDVQILDESLCPRYTGIVVKNVKVGPSPEWLIKRIEAMGLKPINNVVDVTNYVLYATAQPIHAFDLAKISGRKIIVRKARNSEVLKTLENKDVVLSPEMLVIADEGKPVALAGVIGGMESSVQEGTHDVFIESAYFDPISIRLTSKKTGIQTDASYRFERGADVSFPPKAAAMAASLLTQLGGVATRGIVDVYPNHRKNRTVILRQNRIVELLGMEVEEEFTIQTLSNLGFQVELQQKGTWQVKVPYFRVDIEREADLIEEVARFFGYDRIPSHFPPLKFLEPPPDPKRKRINKIRQLLFFKGFDEVLNFSFSDPEKESAFRTGKRAIEIRNPVSSKARLLRTTILGGLLENIVWNENRGAEGVHIFEVGNIYFWEDDTTQEALALGLATTGFFGLPNWKKKEEETDFFHLKGTLESMMTHLRYEPFSFKKENHSFFEPDCSLALQVKGKRIGCLGLVKKSILDFFLIKDSVWAAELDLKQLLEKKPQSFEYVPLTRFPGVRRDISFIAERNVSYREVKEALEELSIPYLAGFDLYDRFSGPSVPKDKVSLSFRFVYVNPQRTLLAEEVDRLQQKIIKALRAKFNFQLREGGKIDN